MPKVYCVSCVTELRVTCIECVDCIYEEVLKNSRLLVYHKTPGYRPNLLSSFTGKLRNCESEKGID